MKNKENNFISAVLYIHNNQSDIANFIHKLNNILDDNFKKYEIICVNDCSDDQSCSEIRSGAKDCNGAIVCIDMGFPHGLESAMNAGVDYASGDFVFEFDTICADYDFNLILDVYNRCLQGYDIVSASPDKKCSISSKMFYSLFNKYSKTLYPLKTERFRVISRRGINRINQMNVSLPYRKVVYANCGLKIDSIAYTPLSDIKLKQPKYTYRSSVAIDSFIIFTDVASKLSITLTFIMMAFSVLVGIYTLIVFISGQPVAGWTTTMLVLSYGFFGMFAILSLVIKYLSVILRLIFKKIKYVIGSIEKL